MKNVALLLGVLTALMAAGPLAAQTPKPAAPVSAATLKRVVTTLAADDMQGRGLAAGAEKAAKYLATEFERAGLQPFPGLSSFEQPFPAYQLRSVSLSATLDGASIEPKRAVMMSGVEEFTWSSSQAKPPRQIVVGPGVSLKPYVDSVFSAKDDILVLVHPSHSKWFNSLEAHYGHQTQYRPSAPDTQTTVLLLTDQTQARNYQISGRMRISQIGLRNVVGVLPGRAKDPQRAAEQVIFSAHYDHIGIIEAVKGDSIANGADDDASGTAAVVALAEYFAKRKDNQRTLVFVAFTAEETGGFGAQHFAKQITPALVVADFNIEMIGTPAKFGPKSAFITGFDKSDFGPILQRNLPAKSFRLEPDPYPEQYLFYRSDNYKLAQLGIPAHTISTVQLPTVKYYHTVKDEVAGLNLSNMHAVVEAIARSAASIVAGQDTPTRIAPEKP